MRLATGWLFVLAACPSPAPGPAAQPQAAPSQPPSLAPAAPVTSDVPIDPAKPMPAESLSGAATLQLGKPATLPIDGRADIFSAARIHRAAASYRLRSRWLPAAAT